MNEARFREITLRYSRLRIAIVGDFCLDRYVEIDPARDELSIETGLAVHNVVRVRAQPGAAGTIANNLAALGVAEILPVGFTGDDGEGYELRRALGALPGIRLDYLIQSTARRTFTYCKPLVLEPGKPPRELNRLDSKNWTPTPSDLQETLVANVEKLVETVDALVLMDQVDLPETGVVTERIRAAVHAALGRNPKLVALADSRRGLAEFPPLGFKMNSAELSLLAGRSDALSVEEAKQETATLARRNGQPVFVTLSENGIVGASSDGTSDHVPGFPVRGAIDIVGAGDSVTAGLTAALAAGASSVEAMHLAMAAASIVIHQLGTTGTASVEQIADLLR